MAHQDILSSFFDLRRLLSQSVHNAISELDVSVLQMHIMQRLSQGSASLKELSEYTIADKASVSRSVSSLEAADLVSRVSSEVDQRKVVIALTPTGLEKVKLINRKRANAVKLVEDLLSPSERKEFMRLMDKLSSSLK